MRYLDGGQVTLYPWFLLEVYIICIAQSQIVVVHQQGLMWEEQPRLGFSSKSSSGKKKKENKINPKDLLAFLCSKKRWVPADPRGKALTVSME